MTLIAIHSSLRYYIYDLLVPVTGVWLFMNHNEDISIGLRIVYLLLLNLLLMNLVRIGYVLRDPLDWRVASDRLSCTLMLPLLDDSLVV